MTIWVDGDACPVVIKDILFRAAERTSTLVTFVANHALNLPKSKYLKMLQVSSGFDVADNEIVRRVAAGDLVVTSDIPLAAEVVEKGAIGLNPRGERYTVENIKATLNMRDFMDMMRSSGVDTGSTAVFSQADRQRFANSLDSWLAQRVQA